MEKELIQKINSLKSIKPDDSFVAFTKKDIIKNTNEKESVGIIDVLFSPVLKNNGVVLAGAFAFLLVFGFYSFPLLPTNYSTDPLIVNIPGAEVAVTEEDDEEQRKITGKENSVKVTGEDTVETRFASADNTLRDITKQVLGTIILENEDRDVNETITDKEIADKIAEGIIGQEETTEGTLEPSMGVMSTEDNGTENKYKENKEVQDAMQLYQEKDYEEFIHTIFDVLGSQELLDILSE